MSEGARWIDEIMAPLAGVESAIYNRIYEAVSRGNDAQGRALIAAIVRLMAEYEADPSEVVALQRAEKELNEIRELLVIRPDQSITEHIRYYMARPALSEGGDGSTRVGG